MISGATLSSLAAFGSSIGATISATYRALNQFNVPNTGIPQPSFNVSAPGVKPGVSAESIILYAVILVAVIFGIRMLKK